MENENEETEQNRLRERVTLLEQERDGYMDMAMRTHERAGEREAQLGRLDHDNQQLVLENQRLKSAVALRDGEIDEMETAFVELQEKNRSLGVERGTVAALEAKVTDLRARNNEQTRELIDNEKLIHQLRSTLSEKERELQLKKSDSGVEISFDTTNSMELRCVSLTERIDVLEQERRKMLLELSSAQSDRIELQRYLVEERRNCEELKEINQGCKETISQQRAELSDLKAEIELAKCNVGIARKGNSMFSEFVDERLKLEDDLKTLKFERDNLAKTLSETQQQLEIQKQQISSMFLLASQRLNHNAEASTEEVVRLRSQLKSLNAQLHALEMKQVDVATLGSVDLSDEMARDIISSLRSRLNEKENSLQDLRMDRDRIQDALCAESAKARQASSRVAFLEAEVANLNQIITNEKFSMAFQKHSLAPTTTRKRPGTVEKITDPPLLSSSSTATSANVSFTVSEKVDENRTHADEHIETKRKRVQWAEEPEKTLMDQPLPVRTTTNTARRGRYLQNVKTNGNDLIFNPQ